MKDIKISDKEMKALVKFWQRYMVARKAWEGKQVRQATAGEYVGMAEWQNYYETKQDCMRELQETFTDIKSFENDIWRQVVGLQPEGVIDVIIRHRIERELEKEQRKAEKAIMTGSMPVTKVTQKTTTRVGKPKRRTLFDTTSSGKKVKLTIVSGMGEEEGKDGRNNPKT